MWDDLLVDQLEASGFDDGFELLLTGISISLFVGERLKTGTEVSVAIRSGEDVILRSVRTIDARICCYRMVVRLCELGILENG